MRSRRSLIRDERGFVHSVEAVLAIMLLLFYTSRMLDTPLRVYEDKKQAQLDELREQIVGVLAGLDRRGLLGDMVFCADYASLDTTLQGVFPERESFTASVTYMVPMTVTETSGLPRRRDPVEVSVDVPLATDTRSFVLRDEAGKILAPLQTSQPWMRIPLTLTWHHLWRRNVTLPISQCTADQTDYYDDIAKGLNCRNPIVELPPADINDDGFLDYPDRNSLALYMEDWFDPRWSFRIKLRSRGMDESKVSDNARVTIKLHELIDHTGMTCKKGVDQNSFIVTDRLGDPVDHFVSIADSCTCDSCTITVDWKLGTAVDHETLLTHWLYFNTLDAELPAADCPSFTADVQKADSGSGKCTIGDWTSDPPNNGDEDLTPRKSVGAITVNGKVETTHSQIQLPRDADYVEIPFTLAAWRDAETYVESRARTGISIIRFQPMRLERAWRFRWHIRAERVNRSVEFRGFVSGAPGSCLGYKCITLEPIGGGDRPDQSKLDDSYYFNKDIYEVAEGSFYICTSTMVGDEVHEVNDIYDLFELNVTIRDEAIDAADRVWRNAMPNAFITIYKPQSRDDEGGPRCASDNSASSTWDSPLFNDDASALISLESGLTLDQMTTLGIVRGDSSSSTTSAGVTIESIDSVKTGIAIAPYPSSYASILPKIPFINSAGNYRLQRRFYLYYAMNSVTLPKDAVPTGTVADPSWYTLDPSAPEHAPRVQVTWLDNFRPRQVKEYYLSFSVGTDESDQGYDTDLEVTEEKQCYDCLSLRCMTYEDCKDYTDGDGDNIIDEDFVTTVTALNNTPIDIGLGPCSTETPSEDCDIKWVAHENMNITRHIFSNTGYRTAVVDETGPVFTTVRMTTNSSSINSRDVIRIYHDTPYILYSKYFIPHKDGDLPSIAGSIAIPIYNFTALKANGASVFDVDEVDFSTHEKWFADWGYPCGNIGVCTVTYAVISENVKKATFSQDRWHDEFADTSGITIAAAGTTNNLAANGGVMSLTADASESTGEDVLLRFDPSNPVMIRTVTITEKTGSTLKDIPVKVSLDTASMIAEGDLTNDCSDLRFELPGIGYLPHWIEKGCSTTATTVWVRVPELSGGGSLELKLHHGNPTWSSLSSFTDTMVAAEPDANTLAMWHFDEGTGVTSADATGRGYTDTIVGASWTDGRFGKGLKFSGGQSVYITKTPELDVSTGLTLEAWVKPTSLDEDMTIVGKRWAYGLIIRPPGRLLFGIWANGEDTVKGSVHALPLNEWTHVAATFDGTYMRIYINGVEDSSRELTAGTNIIKGANSAVFTGTYDTSSGFFTGVLDEIAIHKRALNAKEVLAHALGGRYLVAEPKVVVGKSTVQGTVPHVFSTKGSKLFIRVKRAYTAHGGRSSLQLGVLPDGTGRYTVARWGDTDIPDWTTISFDLEELWGEKPFKHVFLTIEDQDSVATGTRSLYVDSLRVEGSGGTDITIVPTSDSPKAFEAYPFLGSVRVFKEDFRESDDFFRRSTAPFIVEMDQPVTLDGGTPFPSHDADPSTTTATATYAVTSNSRRIGFAWVKLSVWSNM